MHLHWNQIFLFSFWALFFMIFVCDGIRLYVFKK